MQEKTVKLGLVGKDVSKSQSPQIHTFILNEWGLQCEYACFSVSPSEWDDAIRTLLGDFDGFNVTIPYKRDVFEYLDEVVGDALACGAVNTVSCMDAKGYNTDGVGFLQMLQAANVEVCGKKVLVLGVGGAGRSTAAALKGAGAKVYVYRRNQAELEEVCAQLGVEAAADIERGGYDILINCTGVGMHESVGISPVGEKAFTGASCAVDLIYRPAESEFLRLAREQGLQTLNGESMLFYQAYYADCIYTKRKSNPCEAQALYEKYKKRTKGEHV